MTNTVLLIDSHRSFLDGRSALVARTNVEALQLLHQNEKTIKEIWFDDTISGKDGLKPIFEYLTLRAKMGMKYPVNIIYVHTPSEAGWQIINAKLSNAKYTVARASVRDTLGGGGY